MVDRLRHSGLEPLGDVPWGAHLSLFYESTDDLIAADVPFFAAGLRDNERCFWAVDDDLSVEQATAALGRAVPDLDRCIADGAMEIVSFREWCLPDGRFDMDAILAAWRDKLTRTLDGGFDGFRLSGSAFWVNAELLRDGFYELERQLHAWIAGRPVLVLCCYPTRLSTAVDVLDVTRLHEFTLARRQGSWEVLETAELIRAKEELEQLKDELERRVRVRTAELAAANAQLETENRERERAEAALSEAQAELIRAARLTSLGVLAASIGHEVNQPLTAILTNSEASLRLLATTPPNLAEASAALTQIARDARRAGDVIKRLRDLVSGTARHLDVDLNDQVREVAALMRAELQARAVVLRLDLDPGLPHLSGDRLQLQQAVMNLVRNAAEIMTGPIGTREVCIRTRLDRNRDAVLTVEDSGPGVDIDTSDRLFDPFFTTKTEGMGMGLSIVRSITEAHGGRVSVASGEVAGAVFRLSFPTLHATA
jgi:C4-dicarboxylate-specific signal transduction histidine kinase